MYQIAVKYDAMEETPLRYRRKAHSGEGVAEAQIYLNSRDLTVWQNRPEFRDVSRRCTLVHASVPNRRLGRSTAPLRGSRNLERPANAAHRIVVYFSMAGNSGSLSVSRIPPYRMLPAVAIKLAAVRS